MPAWEAELFEAVNGLPDGLWPLVWGPMQAGSLVGSLAAVGGTYAVTRDRRLALAALVGSQVAWWSGKGVKELVARGRPAVFLPDARLREKATGLGYVSGHSAVAFSLVAVLAPAMPRSWRPAAVGAASFVALARLYAGAHLPLDAVGGAGLGVLAGTAGPVGPRPGRRRPAGPPVGGGSDEAAAVELPEAEPAGQDRQPVGQEAVGEDRGDGLAGIEAHPGEAGHQRRLHGAEPARRGRGRGDDRGAQVDRAHLGDRDPAVEGGDGRRRARRCRRG